jgi:multidrug efflux pump subunit AcrA (membrane-fusion protein)
MISSIELSDNISLTIPIINDLPQGAKITKIGIKSNMRGAYPVSAELDNTQSTIHAGMAADVFIQSKLKTLGIILPESAVFIAANGDEQVFIFNPKNNQVSPRTITSQLININQLLITSGLKANDIVCTAGAEFLRDGQQVTLYQATH